jgi:hypothetical protein
VPPAGILRWTRGPLANRCPPQANRCRRHHHIGHGGTARVMNRLLWGSAPSPVWGPAFGHGLAGFFEVFSETSRSSLAAMRGWLLRAHRLEAFTRALVNSREEGSCQFALLSSSLSPCATLLCVRRARTYGSNVSALTWVGRTTVKCRRSSVAMSVSLSRSATAITEASVVPSGRSPYVTTNSAIRA